MKDNEMMSQDEKDTKQQNSYGLEEKSFFNSVIISK